ncbi:LOW QUALITY PROTEIN: hypothetical protein OSB04_000481 [Centaurea solstitialis]|uniref:Cytochrome P450 n=1 Tax=Centaurea solstitialis TaxID=347529 RepID=A0AA38WS46_9ASTR|nr:LOW QUALITY PROTEIN: hypothetical protein OSB04_000481 [Centaurea solstitialis]
MMILKMEELLFLVKNNYDMILVVLFSGLITRFLTTKLRKSSAPSPDASVFLLSVKLSRFFRLLIAPEVAMILFVFADYGNLHLQILYGKWFKTRLFGKVHVSSQVLRCKNILTNDFQLFNKGYVKSMADAVGKNSLLCVPLESHKRIRRLLSAPFSMDSLSKFVQKFDKLVSRRFKKMAENGNSFVVLDFTMKIAFDAMCDMLMSITDEYSLKEMEKDFTLYYKGIKARERLMRLFEETIANRRSSKEAHEDFLQSIKRFVFIDEKLDDSEIMDNMLTLITAGQTTTAAAIMWSVKFLDENKQVQDILREEQLSYLEINQKGLFFVARILTRCLMAQRSSKRHYECLMCCYGSHVLLLTTAKFRVEIKKGWHVNIDATHIHYDPEVYKDPLHFNPSRFDEIQKPYSYIPFGSGPRTCLGINMAKVTMLVFLHRLTSGYTWTVDDLDLSLEKKSHIPRLKSGVPITLTSLKDDQI